MQLYARIINIHQMAVDAPIPDGTFPRFVEEVRLRGYYFNGVNAFVPYHAIATIVQLTQEQIDSPQRQAILADIPTDGATKQ